MSIGLPGVFISKSTPTTAPKGKSFVFLHFQKSLSLQDRKVTAIQPMLALILFGIMSLYSSCHTRIAAFVAWHVSVYLCNVWENKIIYACTLTSADKVLLSIYLPMKAQRSYKVCGHAKVLIPVTVQ